MKEVTIIIPVYNTEKYLSKAIDSCINQTFKDIEIIIVNDGSTDNSLPIAHKYEEEYDGIHVISTENKGLSEARNTGLKAARGKFVYFLDSDDWINPETIEMCYKLATENNLDMVLFDSKVEVDVSLDSTFINDNYYRRDKVVNPNKIYDGRTFIELYANKKGVFVQAWLIFTRREFLIKNSLRFLPNAYYEDVAFHFACMIMIERIMYIPQAYHYRLYRSNSIMTTSLNIRKICSVYEVINEMLSSMIRVEKFDDDIWLQYFIQRVKVLFRTVLSNISRKELSMAETYYYEIISIQKDCIISYYKFISLSEKKTSSIRKALEFAEEVIIPFGWISNEIQDIFNNIVAERERIVFEILSKLPLDKKNSKVGVYGSGKHAEYLLNKYKELIGDIKANLIFIDTYKESFSDKFYDFDIVNVNDIHKVNISEIVILSYFYEEEMYKKIISRYGDQYKTHRIYNGDTEPIDSTTYLDVYNRLIKLNSIGRKRIILINTPEHTNVGDHIITYAVLEFFKEYLPDYDIIEVSNKMYRERSKEVIYRTNVDDIIVITGGGFLGSLWPYSGLNVYEIVKNFPDNKIVILPQSMYFENNEEGERQRKLAYELFVGHANLSVCYRESFSYQKSKIIFEGKVKSYLMPDMALMLNFSKDQGSREGVLICLRHDIEGILTDDEKFFIKDYFINCGELVHETSMHWHSSIKPYQREEVITEKINEFKRYKLVVTDTLHCMISCAISGTPCIALNNINRKLEGIYKLWLDDVDYIRYVSSYEDILCMDMNSWEELNNENHYNKSFEEFMKDIAKVIYS
ncbi:MAG TPA: glycosyltransferase [Clostridiales bacterium]|nr:glycosyltransferase [Clostridiales bacterium]